MKTRKLHIIFILPYSPIKASNNQLDWYRFILPAILTLNCFYHVMQ